MKTNKSKTELKILLLQIRSDEITKTEELDEFIRFSSLNENQFKPFNVFEHPNIPENILHGIDALFIGGSSDASVLNTKKYPFVKDCKNLLRKAYDKNLPVLASCFGFQLAVEEFGGKVIIDEPNAEIGLYPIQLSPKYLSDPLLHDYPAAFWAVSGHQERAERLPPEALHLGKTQACPYHIFTFPKKPFYAFQFHPEVDTQDLINRVTRYKTRYLAGDDALDDIIKSSVHQTTQSNLIVQHFIERVIL
jgi:GMP synthase (glutamine-hydrolysing)